jgi:hypothetical protein
MSTLVAKNIQVGADGTASNNFTIYQPAAPDGTLRIGNGNTGTTSAQVVLTSAGNVGIGTSSPGVKLDISQGTADTNSLKISNEEVALFSGAFGTGSSYDRQFLLSATRTDSGSFPFMRVAGQGGIIFAVDANTERMRIDSAGNVGIGTSSPGSLLNVNAGASGGGGIFSRGGFNYATVSTLASSADAVFGGGVIASATTAEVVKTVADVAHYVKLQITDGITFHTNITGAAGTSVARETNERMRIDSSGNLNVGMTGGGGRVNITAAASQNGVNITLPSNDYLGATVHSTATSGNNQFIAFGTEASFTTRGSISYNRSGGLTAYNTTSDYRAKDIIGPVTDSGALIDATPVYMGKMKGATQERPMFIAHEVPAYAHTGEKDAVDADGNPVYQQMDASALIPVMWAEIQSLRKRLAAANL